MPLLDVRNLSLQFNGKTVLDRISFTLDRGEVKVVMGPSGSGKSTLLRCLNLLETPTDGQIFLNGQDITAPETDIRAVRRQIGFVFQQFGLFRHLDARHNVALALIKLLRLPRRQALDRADRSSPASTCSPMLTNIPPSSPADSSNASPSPAPWPWIPS